MKAIRPVVLTALAGLLGAAAFPPLGLWRFCLAAPAGTTSDLSSVCLKACAPSWASCSGERTSTCERPGFAAAHQHDPGGNHAHEQRQSTKF